MTAQQTFEKRNTLVVGGAGFIGSHLCDVLIKRNRVICVDNFSTGSEENIHHLLPNPDFKFVRHDITEPLDFSRFPELKLFRIPVQGIQEVYNLASPASPLEYTDKPIETLLANALGTKHTLEIAKEHESRYIFFSSAAVYGEPVETGPISERFWGFVNPIGVRSPYSEGKRFAESLIVHYRQKYNLDARILRIFNTYGPRMRLNDGRMVPSLVRDALANTDLVLYGKGESMTSLLYISDLIEAVVKLEASKELGPMNLGSTDPVSQRSVAELVKKLSDSSSNIVERELTGTGALQGIPDITLAKERLGWFPVVKLEEGLRRTIEYLKGSDILRLQDIKLDA